MNCLELSELSVKKFGGKIEDFIKIHKWFDQFRYAIPDKRHLIFLHNTVGIIICEQVFGDYLELASGKKISIRDIAEFHVLSVLGYIKSPEELLKDISSFIDNSSPEIFPSIHIDIIKPIIQKDFDYSNPNIVCD